MRDEGEANEGMQKGRREKKKREGWGVEEGVGVMGIRGNITEN